MASNPSLENNPSLDDWLAFGADGTVVVRSGKVDIGQRISTAVALLVADELDIDPSRVETVRAETGLSPDEGFTSGSQSMAQTGNAVRLAAATARQHMLERAARALEVGIATLEVDDGTIHSRATNRKTLLFGARRRQAIRDRCRSGCAGQTARRAASYRNRRNGAGDGGAGSRAALFPPRHEPAGRAACAAGAPAALPRAAYDR